MSKKPTLLLLPNLLDEEASHTLYLPSSVDEAVQQIDGLICESEKAGRRFLKRFLPQKFRDIPLRLLNEHTQKPDELLEPILKGEWWGLISDCGMPCLADPGANLVFKARQKKITIQVFSGPSSILFALMLSGLGAQHFTFNGYLPKEEKALLGALKELQSRSEKEGSTQLFIETPYRNQKLFAILLKSLKDSTLLSIAADLTGPKQLVLTHTIKEWKQLPPPNIENLPTVFLFLSK